MAKDGPHELRYMRTGPVIENYETVPSATLRKVDFNQGGVENYDSWHIFAEVLRNSFLFVADVFQRAKAG